MTFREIVRAAREVDRYNVCVDRATLFRAVSCVDSYINECPGDDLLANVYSEVSGLRTFSEFAKAKGQKRLQEKNGTKGPQLKVYVFVYVKDNPLFGVGKPLISDQALKQREKDRDYLIKQGVEGENLGIAMKRIDPATKETVVEIHVIAKNHCWARMLLAKELSHLCVGTFLFDDRDSIVATADKILRQAEKWKQNIKGPDSEIQNDESVGVYHAWEVVIPWRLRQEGADAWFHTSEEIPRLARRFMIPERIIKHYFAIKGYGEELFPNDRRLYSYCTFSHRVNEMIKEEEIPKP